MTIAQYVQLVNEAIDLVKEYNPNEKKSKRRTPPLLYKMIRPKLAAAARELTSTELSRDPEVLRQATSKLLAPIQDDNCPFHMKDFQLMGQARVGIYFLEHLVDEQLVPFGNILARLVRLALAHYKQECNVDLLALFSDQTVRENFEPDCGYEKEAIKLSSVLWLASGGADEADEADKNFATKQITDVLLQLLDAIEKKIGVLNVGDKPPKWARLALHEVHFGLIKPTFNELDPKFVTLIRETEELSKDKRDQINSINDRAS